MSRKLFGPNHGNIWIKNDWDNNQMRKDNRQQRKEDQDEDCVRENRMLALKVAEQGEDRILQAILQPVTQNVHDISLENDDAKQAQIGSTTVMDLAGQHKLDNTHSPPGQH